MVVRWEPGSPPRWAQLCDLRQDTVFFWVPISLSAKCWVCVWGGVQGLEDF